ncbi:DUF4062 domain-containing protein [Flindersiella endophytica]
MTIEKREQAFISSTYIDLQEERQEVIQTLLEADCIPSGMELFPASDDDRWTLIKRVIDDCDYYLIIVGGRYGSVDPEQDISYTEMEFDYAVSQHKPVMAFLHKTPEDIPSGKTDLNDTLRRRLDSFREKVAQRMVKYWDTPQSLGGQVAKSLIQIRKTHPTVGWVRADNLLTPEVERELAELRARVAELVAELESVQHQKHIQDIEGLAQGNDVYKMRVEVEYYPTAIVEKGGPYARSSRERGLADYNTTWNQIIAALAPMMIDEADEDGLFAQLSALGQKLAQSDPTYAEYIGSVTDVDVTVDSFHDVLVQLLALGVIEQSERRRPVSDQNTYWRLTGAGREQLLRLRTVRKDEPAGEDSSGEDDGRT